MRVWISKMPSAKARNITGNAITATGNNFSSSFQSDLDQRILRHREEFKKRREQEEKHAKEEEFLRTSLRGSKKLQALESVCEDRTFPTGEPKAFVNEAYDIDGDRLSHPLLDITLEKPVVDSLVTRGLRICDKNNAATNRELSFIISCLQNNGYPEAFVERRTKIQKYKMANRKPPEDKDDSETYIKRVCLPYYPKVTEKMASYIRRNTGLELAYSPQNKISGHLSSHKDRKTLIDTGIYRWTCDGSETEQCEKLYIGESRKGLAKRSAQHMYHIYSGNINASAVAEHICTTGHMMDPNKIELIEREPNTIRRKVKEGLYIQHTENTVNKNNGYSIHPAWAHTLKKKFYSHVSKKFRPP